MKFELKSIGVWSAIKVLFFFNLVMGFLCGLITALLFSTIGAFMSGLPGYDTGAFGSDMIPAGIAIIMFPIVYSFGLAFFGTIVGVIGVVVYNLFARLFGGLELTLDKAEFFAVPPIPQAPMTYGHQHGAPPPPPPSAAPTQASAPWPSFAEERPADPRRSEDQNMQPPESHPRQ